MSFFKPTPEELAARQQRDAAERAAWEKAKAGELAAPKQEHAAEAKHRQEAQFAASPVGQARAAKAAGLKMFQTAARLAGYTKSSASMDCAIIIQSIEEEGWRLEHVGYVYRMALST